MRRAGSSGRACGKRRGVTRIVTIGTGIDSCRAALALADEHDGVFASLGVDPHQAATAEAGRLDELRELLAHPKAVAVGETGLDNVKLYATPAEQRRLFDEQLALAADLDLPVVIHSREAAADTASALEGFPGTVILHCFSSPDLLPAALEREVLRLLRGKRHVSEGWRASRCRRGGASRPDPRRDRQPVSLPATRARPPERAGARRPHDRGARRGSR